MSSCTLQKPYERTGLEPTALIFLCSSTLKVPDDFKYFKYLSICFSRFKVKLSKPFLVSTISSLALPLRNDSICLIQIYLSKTTTDFPLSDFCVTKLICLISLNKYDKP